MTRFQRLLYMLGFGRFKRYRRWIGGRWVERHIEAAVHSSELDRWRWEPDPAAKFDDQTHAIEQWPIALPEAYARQQRK